jgi:divalent metal cation (Fe/Co/Zn/Cd) transporter
MYPQGTATSSEVWLDELHTREAVEEFCTYLSGILLAGLLLNALVGLWWADPVAGLVIVPIIAKEGFEGLQGKACDDCSRL